MKTQGITPAEAAAIVGIVRPTFVETAATYDTKKYWPETYERVLVAFRTPANVSPDRLDEALRWKWGHLGKSGMPAAHRRLISQVQRDWNDIVRGLPPSPDDAFERLRSKLVGTSRFITVAFLLHLLFQEQIHIIDQHNFRAVNALMRQVRPAWPIKKRPSRYADIQLVGTFISSVGKAWSQEDPSTAPSSREMDKFLMMHGKKLKRESSHLSSA